MRKMKLIFFHYLCKSAVRIQDSQNVDRFITSFPVKIWEKRALDHLDLTLEINKIRIVFYIETLVSI